MRGELPADWDAALGVIPAEKGPLATRQASHTAVQALSAVLPEFIGGSADLAESTGTARKTGGTFGPSSTGTTVNWGIREHAMGAAMNGMAAHGGCRPFGSTFLVFFDYMKPSIRLASLMKLPVIFVGTHDSIGVGEDGPTHQPIDQLAMLRAIPGLVTLRPADANETIDAWREAIARTTGPTALVMTRQKLPVLPPSAGGVARGAYVLHEPEGGPQAILIATGSEVHVAIGAAKLLAGEGVRARVVSMPSWELFAAQDQGYRDQVLPPAIRARVAIEAASPMGWERWTTSDGAILAMRSFGASAPGDTLFKEFGFTPTGAAALVRDVLARSPR